MKVSVVPVAVDNGQICSLYKLEMKLYKPKHYPKYADILIEDWEKTLKKDFLRAMEDAIEQHVKLLSKISGIKSDSSQSLKEDGFKFKNACDDGDGDNDGGSGGEDVEEVEDLGTDAQKRKRQGRDEIDYEDGAGEETHEGEQLEETIGEDGNQDESDVEVNENDTTRVSESKHSKSIDEKPKRKSKQVPKRATFVEAKGMHFEVHFKFIKDPYILLAQVICFPF